MTGGLFSEEDFGYNLETVRRRIVEAGGDLDRVRIIAVSKGQSVEAIRVAIKCGHREFGENYADELVEKAAAIGTAHAVRWHFQGRLQTNKINRLKPHVSVWQTVDSTDRALALAARVPGAEVFVQVDSTGGVGDRSGALATNVPAVVDAARHAGLRVFGLMTVAPLSDDPTVATMAFRELCTLADALGLPVRSIGMSDDLERAVGAGSTMVRLGSALFGPRPTH